MVTNGHSLSIGLTDDQTKLSLMWKVRMVLVEERPARLGMSDRARKGLKLQLVRSVLIYIVTEGTLSIAFFSVDIGTWPYERPTL